MSTAERTLPTSLYAVVGAGDVVVAEAREALEKLRNRAETAQARITETGTKLAELPTDVDAAELRAKLNKDELVKLATPYIESATGLYKSLAERGEGAVERLSSQSTLVQGNLERVGKVYSEAASRTEEALGVVSAQTRAVGEKAAALAGRTADKVEDAAVDIEEAGNKVKAEAAAAADKVDAAAKKAPAKKAATPRKTTARKAAPKTAE